MNLFKTVLTKAMNATAKTMAFGIPNTVGGFMAVKAAGMAIDLGVAVVSTKISARLMTRELEKLRQKKTTEQNSEKASA